MVTIAGLATSRGFAAGTVFLYSSANAVSIPEFEIEEGQVEAELSRYRVARAETRRQLEALSVELRERLPNGPDIFENHLLLFNDASVIADHERLIREEHLNAEAAIRRTTDVFRAMFGRMKDPYLRERVRDLDDIERRLLRVLVGREDNAFSLITSPVIVVADDLTPSETISLPRGLILGFATERGSTTSHVALLARALGIPAVVGLAGITSRVHAGDHVLLDGTNGAVTVNPDAATYADFERLVSREHELRELLAEDKAHAGAMKDGTPVALRANVQPGVPLGCLSSFGAQGIGLYRSEYLWLGADRNPTEEEQYAAYAEAVTAVAAMGGDARAVFRVLDLGGDKMMRSFATNETNPFLGCRSIRWLLSHRDVFRTQLRAILRASALGPSAIMYPMVATREELREANLEVANMMQELRTAGIAFDEHILRGCMVEIPSAALNAPVFAKEVDFFSIGTNDLVQYTMAADRGNEQVSYLYQPANPAVVKLVDMTIRAARAAGIPVAVCGESASDPVFGVLWVALGATSLSMSAGFIPVIKKTLRALTSAEVAELAAQVRARLDDLSAAEVYALCRDFLISKVPQLEEIQSMFISS